MAKQFETYEQVAQHLLNCFASEFGLSCVEGKPQVKGEQSGVKWTIDAKGIRIGADGFVTVECRRYTSSRLKQEHLAAIAFRIADTGAKGGIVVSPLELQRGARKLAQAKGITEVRLNSGCNCQEFVLSFLNKVMIGVCDSVAITESISIRIS